MRLVLSNWIMDANTYQVLNQLLPERMGPGGTDDSGLIGYNVADSTIASDPLDCSTANGAIESLWDTKLNLSGHDVTSDNFNYFRYNFCPAANYCRILHPPHCDFNFRWIVYSCYVAL
ncbi:unnamed protein product [Aphanomyces euteiches]